MSCHRPAFELSARARRDYDEILLYSQVTWGEQRMREYELTLERSFETLAQFPNIGRRRPDLGPGMRSHPVGQHIAYYQVEGGGVIVARILHARRDATAQVAE